MRRSLSCISAALLLASVTLARKSCDESGLSRFEVAGCSVKRAVTDAMEAIEQRGPGHYDAFSEHERSQKAHAQGAHNNWVGMKESKANGGSVSRKDLRAAYKAKDEAHHAANRANIATKISRHKRDVEDDEEVFARGPGHYDAFSEHERGQKAHAQAAHNNWVGMKESKANGGAVSRKDLRAAYKAKDEAHHAANRANIATKIMRHKRDVEDDEEILARGPGHYDAFSEHERGQKAHAQAAHNNWVGMKESKANGGAVSRKDLRAAYKAKDEAHHAANRANIATKIMRHKRDVEDDEELLARGPGHYDAFSEHERGQKAHAQAAHNNWVGMKESKANGGAVSRKDLRAAYKAKDEAHHAANRANIATKIMRHKRDVEDDEEILARGPGHYDAFSEHERGQKAHAQAAHNNWVGMKESKANGGAVSRKDLRAAYKAKDEAHHAANRANIATKIMRHKRDVEDDEEVLARGPGHYDAFSEHERGQKAHAQAAHNNWVGMRESKANGGAVSRKDLRAAYKAKDEAHHAANRANIATKIMRHKRDVEDDEEILARGPGHYDAFSEHERGQKAHAQAAHNNWVGMKESKANGGAVSRKDLRAAYKAKDEAHHAANRANIATKIMRHKRDVEDDAEILARGPGHYDAFSEHERGQKAHAQAAHNNWVGMKESKANGGAVSRKDLRAAYKAKDEAHHAANRANIATKIVRHK